MNYPQELKYTKEHEWVRLEGKNAVVGITEFAQGELGDVVFVELPEVGKEVNLGDGLGVIESVKAVSDIFSPLSGKVAKVNDSLTEQPELVNQSPYQEGWIAVLEWSDEEEMKGLLSAAEYEAFVTEGK